MSTVTTRTGRRVVPTPAAAAAQAAAAASSAGTGSGNTQVPSAATPVANPKSGARTTRGTKADEKDAPIPKDSPSKSSSPGKDPLAAVDTPKRRVGLRTTRCSSGSAEESVEKSTPVSATENSPPAKKLKASPATPTNTAQENEDVETPSIESSVELALSKMFEEASPEKENTQTVPVNEPEQPAESTEEPPTADSTRDLSEAVIVHTELEDPGIEAQTIDMEELDTQVVEQEQHTDSEIVESIKIDEPVDTDIQQNSAIESILPHDSEDVSMKDSLDQELPEVVELRMEDADADKIKDLFPSWNEQGCIICNVDICIDDPANVSRNHDKVKDFFMEFFSIGDAISVDGENAFPFCIKCAEDMESLLGINHKIEFMHKQFNKVRDSLAKKAIKTFLVRTKPSCLEEDAKTESYGFLDDEQKKSYKDQMFNLWKSRYELVQPGPKTPIMIRSMDSRGRVTVVRLNSQGQPIPEKYGNIKRYSGTDIPIGGIGRTVMNGDDDSEGNGDGTTSLDIYQCKECPKSFSAKAMLAYHSRIHSGELPFECELCGKAFSVPHYLMTHMRSHTGEKPYKCNECGKGFAQRGGLVTHALVHTGAKPYCCEVCGKSFRQKYHLTQHNLIHSGVKPFSCDLCGKCFNVKMNLREHMRRHTGDRPYKCPYCTSIGFFRKKMLKDHIVKAHPQRPMPIELMAAESDTRESMTLISADSNDSSHSVENEETGGSISILPDTEMDEEHAN